MSDRYHFMHTKGFENQLSNLSTFLLKLNNNSFSKEIIDFVNSLDSILYDPRSKKHWDARVIVHKDNHGSVLDFESIDNSVNLDTKHLNKVEYVISCPIYVELSSSLLRWGTAFVNYSVNDDDLVVNLMSIEFVPSASY